MTGTWFKGIFPTREKPAEIDTTVAHPARVYDYWLGGKDNFAADREAAERVLAVAPGLRFRVRANRAFLARTVRFLATECDVRQFLDIGASQAEVQKRYNERVATPQTLRSHAQVCRFFDGLQLVPPGVVYVHTWRADPDDEPPTELTSAHGGMARKP